MSKIAPRFNSGKRWRVQSDDRGEFDEIVVGDWLHVERLDTNHYYVRIGERVSWATPEKDGRVTITYEEDRPARARAAKGER